VRRGRYSNASSSPGTGIGAPNGSEDRHRRGGLATSPASGAASVERAPEPPSSPPSGAASMPAAPPAPAPESIEPPSPPSNRREICDGSQRFATQTYRARQG